MVKLSLILFRCLSENFNKNLKKPPFDAVGFFIYLSACTKYKEKKINKDETSPNSCPYRES